MKVRSQLVLLALFALLPVAILAAVLGAFLIDQQRETFRRGTEGRALALLSAIDSQLKGSIDTLQAMAQVKSLDHGDLRLFRETTSQILAHRADWVAVNLALPNGQQIFNTRIPEGRPLPMIANAASSLPLLRQGKPVVDDMVIGPTTKRWDFAVRVPVIRQGKLRYIVSAVVDPRSISRLVAEQHLPAEWEGMVLDAKGHIVARTVDPETSVGQPPTEGLRHALARSASGWYSGPTLDGAGAYRAYRRSEVTGWTFAIAIPAAAVDAPSTRAAWIYTLALAGVIAIATVLARAIGQRISRPIAALASANEKLARGEDVDAGLLESSHIDELRSLENAFSHAVLAQAQLKRAEEQMRSVVEHVVDGIITIDAHGTIESLNRAAERLFGFAASEVVGKNVSALMPSPYGGEHDGYIANYLRSGQPKIIGIGREVLGQRKDGSIFPMDLAVSEFRIGARRFFTGIVRDITDRKDAEEKLRSSEARLRMALTAGGMGNWEWDLRTYAVTWSPDLEAIHGLAPGTFPGTLEAYRQDVHPEDREKVERAIAQSLEQDDHHIEYRIVRPDGEVRWVEARGMVFREASGAPTRMAGVCTDVTERKLVELELQRERERLTLALGAGQMGAYDFNLVENRLWWSPETYTLFGVSAETSAPSRDAFDALIHPEDRELFWRHLEESMAQRQTTFTHEFRTMRPDGQLRWIGTRAETEYDAAGRPLRHFGVALDITERKRMEIEAGRAQKLESIGLLAGGIAHDFNNLLTAIFGHIELARLQLVDRPAVADLLSQAETAFQRARALTHQLLTFARGGAPIRSIAALGPLLVENASFALRGSNIELEFAIAEDLHAANVDVDQIGQAISNIVINAREAMPDGGRLRVSARNFNLEEGNGLALTPGPYLEINFDDSGPGIAEAHLRLIFDPYFTTKPNGTGLGLPTAYSIAKRHGGLITARSNPDAGARFGLYLPASPDQVPAEVQRRRAVRQARGRVLLMDDEPTVRKVGKAMLDKLGYEATEACEGSEAVRLYDEARAKGGPFAAVILDLTVPGGMGGRECVERLKEIDAEVRAIVSSGYSNDPVLAQYRQYGFVAVVAKPYRLDELENALATATIRSNRERAPSA